MLEKRDLITKYFELDSKRKKLNDDEEETDLIFNNDIEILNDLNEDHLGFYDDDNKIINDVNAINADKLNLGELDSKPFLVSKITLDDFDTSNANEKINLSIKKNSFEDFGNISMKYGKR